MIRMTDESRLTVGTVHLVPRSENWLFIIVVTSLDHCIILYNSMYHWLFIIVVTSLDHCNSQQPLANSTWEHTIRLREEICQFLDNCPKCHPNILCWKGAKKRVKIYAHIRYEFLITRDIIGRCSWSVLSTKLGLAWQAPGGLWEM